MSILGSDNPTVESYLTMFDRLSPEEQAILLKKLRQKPTECEKSKSEDEEFHAAVRDFKKEWRGCLKGIPHMTAKEIRAERLETKYGNRK